MDKSDETEREDSLVIANIADFVTMAKKNRAPSTLLALQIISIACSGGERTNAGVQRVTGLPIDQIRAGSKKREQLLEKAEKIQKETKQFEATLKEHGDIIGI